MTDKPEKPTMSDVFAMMRMPMTCSCYLCGADADAPIAAQHVAICPSCAEHCRLQVLPDKPSKPLCPHGYDVCQQCNPRGSFAKFQRWDDLPDKPNLDHRTTLADAQRAACADPGTFAAGWTCDRCTEAKQTLAQDLPYD